MLQNGVMMESLEGRRFLSGTVLPVGSGLAASPAAIVKAAILRPSLVEGTYKGTATDTSGSTSGDTLALKLVVTSTKETLTVEGHGSGTVKLSASAFKKLREGIFSYDDKIAGYTVKFSGKVTDSGLRISGTGSITGGSGSVTGTFVLKK